MTRYVIRSHHLYSILIYCVWYTRMKRVIQLHLAVHVALIIFILTCYHYNYVYYRMLHLII